MTMSTHAQLKVEYDGEGYAKYPPDEEVRQAKQVLKPAGILSNSFNKYGLKKVERDWVPAKNDLKVHIFFISNARLK